MKNLRIFSGLAAFAALVASTSATPHVARQASNGTTVDLGYASYQGTFNSTSNITEFFGVRYAAPPVGSLRFQAPTAPATVSGVLQADTMPQACPQGVVGTSPANPFVGLGKRQAQNTTEIEDCLFVNVYVSGEVTAGQKLPVLVWFHGGGYVYGAASGYNGADLVDNAGGGVVVVIVQYRLSLFGFLPGKEVKAKGALNIGLLDQEFALKWVQSKIHNFGGDPNYVTIWGESAGGGSVLSHIVAHGGNTQPPLFKHGMTSSSYLPTQFTYDDPQSEDIYNRTVAMANCTKAVDTFACLVDVDASALQAINAQLSPIGFFSTNFFVPVVDGTFLIERPVETLQKGKVNGELLFSVVNQFEGRLFTKTAISTTGTLEDFTRQLAPRLNSSLIDEVASLYNDIGLETVDEMVVALFGEMTIICPTYYLLSAFPGKSYKGQFSAPPAIHASDLIFYFTSLDTSALLSPAFEFSIVPTVRNATFQASFAGSFLGVTKWGSPNYHPVSGDITPHWDFYSNGATEMLFNITATNETDIHSFTTDPGLVKRCNWWKSNAASVPY